MKRLFLLLSIITLTVSCKKEVEKARPQAIISISGTWIWSEARYSQMPNWVPVGDTVVITNSWLYGAWNKPYQRISNTQLIINSADTINLTVTSSTMLWVQGLDSARFIRL